MRIGAVVALVIAMITGCQKQDLKERDKPCVPGKCGDALVCHPEQGRCVPPVEVTCDPTDNNDPVCGTGQACDEVGSFLPCSNDTTVTDCEFGCRTCTSANIWSNCSQGTCEETGTVENCSRCGDNCLSQTGVAEATCVAGACDITRCAAGFADDPSTPEEDCSQTCTVTPDDCDGVDNDCNGIVDDETNPTAACQAKNPTSENVASWSCNADQCVIDACTAGAYDLDSNAPGCEYVCPTNPAAAEVCDGVDNDCDGETDEDEASIEAGCDALYDAGIPADSKPDAWTCSASQCLAICPAGRTPSDPSDPSLGCDQQCTPTASSENNGTAPCDGEDNDCNGIIDDSTQAALQQFCVGAASNPVNVNTWVCNSGTQTCDIICEPGFGRANALLASGCPCAEQNNGIEICDGEDDDCDGLIDNFGALPEDICDTTVDCDGSPCPPGETCDASRCNRKWDCIGKGFPGASCVSSGCEDTHADLTGDLACEYQCPAGGVQGEVCDTTLIDQDCDGIADTNDADADAECATTHAGVPGTTGNWSCVDDGGGAGGRCDPECSGMNVDLNNDPSDGCECPDQGEEICDGNNIDDDCDGENDSVDPDISTYCDKVCGGPGCTNATWTCGGSGCVAGCTNPEVDADGDPSNGCECTIGTSTCDGVDNDCDGTADNTAAADADCAASCTLPGCDPSRVTAWSCVDDSGGTCDPTCAAAYDDRNSDGTDGCECTLAAQVIAGAASCGVIDPTTTTANYQLYEFDIDLPDCVDTLEEVTVTLVDPGNLQVAELGALTLWRDDGDGIFNNALDTNVRSVSPDGSGFVTFTDDGTPGNPVASLPVGTTTFFITATFTRLGLDIPAPNLVAVYINADTDVTLGQSTTSGTFPVTTGTHTVSDTSCDGMNSRYFGASGGDTTESFESQDESNWFSDPDSDAVSNNTASGTNLSNCAIGTGGGGAIPYSDNGRDSDFLHVETGIPLGLPLCELTTRVYAVDDDLAAGACFPTNGFGDYTSLSVYGRYYIDNDNVSATDVVFAPTPTVSGLSASGCGADYVEVNLLGLYQSASADAAQTLSNFEFRFYVDGDGDLDSDAGLTTIHTPELWYRIAP